MKSFLRLLSVFAVMITVQLMPIQAKAQFFTPAWPTWWPALPYTTYFPIQAAVSVYPANVQATVYNAYAAPIACRVQTAGLTQTGVVVYSYANVIALPGQYAYAYAYANYPFYFVNAQAVAYCSY